MSKLEKLVAAFRACKGTFGYQDFVRMLLGLGYKKLKPGKTSGSKRKFIHDNPKHKIYFDEPHDGTMKRGMVKRLQENLEDKGMI